MGCNCCDHDDPCSAFDDCEWCHEEQSFSVDASPLIVDHISLMGTYTGQSIAYDVAVTHTCSNHPFTYHTSGPYPTLGTNGSVQTTNPYASAYPDNSGDSSFPYRTVYLDGDVEVGFVDPYKASGQAMWFGDSVDQRPFGYNSMYGSYFIPTSAWAEASGGTHFSKNCTVEFDIEQFGCPNTTAPKLFRDDSRATLPNGNKAYDIKFCLGTMDYVGGYGGGDSQSNTNRQAITRRMGLCFGEATFAPWTTQFNHPSISGGGVELFAMSCQAECHESNDGSPHFIPGAWGNNSVISSTDTFDDSDGVTYTTYDEIVQAESGRTVWLSLPGDIFLTPSGLTSADRDIWIHSNRNQVVSNSLIVDTGGTVADFDSGSSIIMTATTTNVTYTVECGFVVQFDFRIQIPASSFDRTFQGEITLLRCSGNGVSGDWVNSHVHAAGATARWQVKSGKFLNLAAATDLKECIDGDGNTVVTSADVPNWTDWVNDYITRGYTSKSWNGSSWVIDDPSNFDTDDTKMTGYINRVTNLVVGGDSPPNNAVLVLAEAKYNFNSGAQANLKSGEFASPSIPHNTTWDVQAEPNWEAPVAGDTVELIFDNYGVESADITNLTFDGDLFSSIDKTTDTVNGFERVTFTLTVKAGIPAMGSFDDTTITTHDEGGNYIPSPFNFTIRQGDGGVTPPP